MLATKEPLLIVDDDEAFCQVLQRALVRRGFEVVVCHSLLEAHNACARQEFLKAVVDLKIAQESGLRLIRALKTLQPAMAIIMLTGYSSISTAVEAIKLGALNYLCKPVAIEDVLKAFVDSPLPVEISAPISVPSMILLYGQVATCPYSSTMNARIRFSLSADSQNPTQTID